MNTETGNLGAFLDALAFSEIGPELLALSDNGYNVCVGSTPKAPILFDSYAEHPRRRFAALNSDAAGRYQFMGRYWSYYKSTLLLQDFGPQSQDLWCCALIRECHAMDAVRDGRFREAIAACRSRWASLPGAGYGQHENHIESLERAYVEAGGTLA